MIYVSYECTPRKTHPDFDRVGGAIVNCWLRVLSFDEAKRLAEGNLVDQQWDIVSLNEIWRVPQGFYQDDDPGYRYYEQAKIDREVYVFHLYPKYPVLCVTFEVVAMRDRKNFEPGTRAEVDYWVVNEKVSPTADFLDGFWDRPAHQRKAIAMGRRSIASERWRVTKVSGSKPISYWAVAHDEQLTQYYDEAEDDGECLVFYLDA